MAIFDVVIGVMYLERKTDARFQPAPLWSVSYGVAVAGLSVL